MGGIATGIGTSVVLKSHSSTGGTDLLSYVIRSYYPNARPGSIIVIADIIIVSLNVLVFKEIEIGLYSAITIYIMGKMIDVVFEGVNFTKMMFIISDKYIEIAEKVGHKVSRGSTALYAKGMYTKEEKMMLVCIASRNEYTKIKEIATQIDPDAFIIITNAREVFGKGFKNK